MGTKQRPGVSPAVADPCASVRSRNSIGTPTGPDVPSPVRPCVRLCSSTSRSCRLRQQVNACPGCTLFASVVAAGRQRVRQRRHRILEVGPVEQVEDLDTELRVARRASKREVLRDSTMSICPNPGPCSDPRSRFPYVPGFGVEKAAGLKNSRPPFEMNGSTPETRSGLRTLRVEPPFGVLITAVRPTAGLLNTVPAPST